MENTSLSSDASNDVTTSLSESDDVANKIAYIRDRVLKVIYIIIGTVGIVDNLFVIAIFILFIKIAEKVQFQRKMPEIIPSKFISLSKNLSNGMLNANGINPT